MYGCIVSRSIFSALQATELKPDLPSGACMSLSVETNKQQGRKPLPILTANMKCKANAKPKRRRVQSKREQEIVTSENRKIAKYLQLSP